MTDGVRCRISVERRSDYAGLYITGINNSFLSAKSDDPISPNNLRLNNSFVIRKVSYAFNRFFAAVASLSSNGDEMGS